MQKGLADGAMMAEILLKRSIIFFFLFSVEADTQSERVFEWLQPNGPCMCCLEKGDNGV